MHLVFLVKLSSELGRVTKYHSSLKEAVQSVFSKGALVNEAFTKQDALAKLAVRCQQTVEELDDFALLVKLNDGDQRLSRHGNDARVLC